MSTSETSQQTVPAQGWHVQIVAANGHIHEPDILDDPQRTPKTNDFPQIHIPVRKNEKWLDPQFEQAEMRVWCDGERQPIDRLDRIELQSGKAVLRGRGGVELDKPVEVQYSEKAIHEAARELIDEETPYTADVDEPETEIEENVTVADLTTTEDFINNFELRETDPIEIGDGYIGPYKTCRVYDAVDDNNITAFTDVNTVDWFSGGKNLGFIEENDQVIFGAVRFNYRVPAENVGIKVRDQTLGSSNISFQWNGQEFERNEKSDTPLQWNEIGGNSFYSNRRGYQTRIGEDIQPNTNYWFKIIADGASDYRLDSVAVYDNRFDYTWDNWNGGDGSFLAGPEEYPDSVWISSRELPQTRAVVGGELTANLNNTDSVAIAPQIGFSQTQGDFYLTSKTKDPETTGEWDNLDTPGGSLKIGFRFSRFGDGPKRQKIPTKGYDPHRILSCTLRADLSTLPIVVNQSYNQRLSDVLTDLANRGNFIWEYQRDPNTGEPRIKWTQVGQHETTVDVGEVDYRVEKDSSQIVQQTSVYGTSQSYIARFQANTGTAVGLPNTRLQELSETVRNPRTGERFDHNEDYVMDYENGTIKAKNDGLMKNNAWYEIEYQYQTYGEYQLPGVSNPDRLPPQDISALSSNTACSQAARTLITEMQTPQFEADVTIPNDTIEWSLSEALNIEGLETNDQALKIRNVDQRPGETVLTLGIGRSVSEIIQDIESRVSSVSRNS